MENQAIESLESKAKRALGIIREIDKLSNNLSNLNKVQFIKFISVEDSVYFDADRSDIVFDLRKTYEASVLEEIRSLEKELSEISFKTEKTTSAKVAI